jgi:hypothetical protein
MKPQEPGAKKKKPNKKKRPNYQKNFAHADEPKDEKPKDEKPKDEKPKYEKPKYQVPLMTNAKGGFKPQAFVAGEVLQVQS